MVINSNQGFTLIEILIVIVIIGIITVIAYPNLIGLTDTANDQVINANLRSLLSEIEVYATQEDSYPAWNTGDFINNPEEWNSLAEIIKEIGDDKDLYNYEQSDDNFVFSVELPDGKFVGISKSNGLNTDIDKHLEL